MAEPLLCIIGLFKTHTRKGYGRMRTIHSLPYGWTGTVLLMLFLQCLDISTLLSTTSSLHHQELPRTSSQEQLSGLSNCTSRLPEDGLCNSCLGPVVPDFGARRIFQRNCSRSRVPALTKERRLQFALCQVSPVNGNLARFLLKQGTYPGSRYRSASHAATCVGNLKKMTPMLVRNQIRDVSQF